MAPKTLTVNDVERSATESKFGGYSGYFSGATNDYISIPDDDDWNFGTGEFTIDFWLKWITIPTSAWKEIISQLTDVGTYNSSFALGSWTGNPLAFVYFPPPGTTAVIIDASNFTWDTNWTHIAVVRDNVAELIRIFVNGIQKGSGVITGSVSLYDSTKPLTIGGRNDTDAHNINGYIDELRISKGIAVWTSNFTPPTGAYT